MPDTAADLAAQRWTGARPRCTHCPVLKVCAWDCQQGWGQFDILVFESLVCQVVVAASTRKAIETEEVTTQALWESYN